MANEVRNLVEFDAPFNKKEFIKKFFTEYEHGYFFDFEKVIPMPKELKLGEGSLSDIALSYYRKKATSSLDQILTQINPKLFEKFEDDDIFSGEYAEIVPFLSEKSQKIIKEKRDFTNEESLLILHDIGKILDDNITKYNFPTWFGWSLFNWGTKGQPFYASLYDSILEFTTLNNPPIPIYRKLSYLDYNFTARYADEVSGYGCGIIVSYNRSIHNTKLQDCSKKAYKISKELWGR